MCSFRNAPPSARRIFYTASRYRKRTGRPLSPGTSAAFSFQPKRFWGTVEFDLVAGGKGARCSAICPNASPAPMINSRSCSCSSVSGAGSRISPPRRTPYDFQATRLAFFIAGTDRFSHQRTFRTQNAYAQFFAAWQSHRHTGVQERH